MGASGQSRLSTALERVFVADVVLGVYLLDVDVHEKVISSDLGEILDTGVDIVGKDLGEYVETKHVDETKHLLDPNPEGTLSTSAKGVCLTHKMERDDLHCSETDIINFKNIKIINA